ncbi:hypothetical protein [Pseudochrobactrum sp. MP213Fo]|uniref:hypothetical protein n=1 Tax=Pseudochrobactrum sp. MP213Fo TaxID=3022250 RepID=UPI003BA33E8D
MPRLLDLDTLDLIRMTCSGCNRTRELPARFMAVCCGEEISISEIKHRLRCNDCGHRDNNKVEVLYGKVDMNGDYFVYQEKTRKQNL